MYDKIHYKKKKKDNVQNFTFILKDGYLKPNFNMINLYQKCILVPSGAN